MFRKTLSRILLTATASLLAGGAQAATIDYLDVDEIGVTLNGMNSSGPSVYEHTFSIVDNETDVVTIGGEYWNSGQEQILIDSTDFMVGTSVQSAYIALWLSGDTQDTGLMNSEIAIFNVLSDGEWPDVLEVDFTVASMQASGELLAQISETGEVEVRVRSLLGEFTVEYGAMLVKADGTSIPASVPGGGPAGATPEPSAVALFGVGALLVASAIRRRS